MLILVLWMSTVLGLMSYSVLYQMSIEARLNSSRNRSNQALMLARAGLAKAFVDLRNDMVYDQNEQREGNPRFDALGEIWADVEQDKLDYELGPGHFNVEVIDAESRLNLNRITAANKVLLDTIIEQIGYSEDDARIVAAAIIDYMDSDDVPLLENAEGTEGEAYGRLMAEAEGRRICRDDVPVAVFPNEPFLTIDGLLDVYGVTPALFFGPDTPEAEYYDDLLGERWGGNFQMSNRRRSRFAGPPVGLRDFFTLDGSGQLNVNTAPRHVLQALMEAAGDTGAEMKADSITRRRSSARGRSDDAFKTLQDFQNSSEIGGLMQAMMAMHPLTVESTVFTVRSTGTVGEINRTLEAVVSRNWLQVPVNETLEELDRQRDRARIRQDRRDRWEDPDNANMVNIPNLRIKRWNPNSTAIANEHYDGRRRR